MKQLVLIPIAITLFSLVSKATIHVVHVANFQFSPASVPDVMVGDTMRWMWVSGSHTTTDDISQPATSFPDGAPSWSSPINVTNKTFDYKVTVAGVYNYLCIPHAPNMKASFTASDAVFPIKLSSFAVTSNHGQAIIKWNTMTEQNVDYFSVRRSLNGTTYFEIAKVPAAGNSTSEKAYSYTDPNIEKGKYYYYTLVTVDKDKKEQFSETKMFKGDGAISKLVLTLSPNPISGSGHLMMTFNALKEGKMQVSVVNSQGQTIIKNEMQAYQGVNNGHVHLGNLTPGTYTIVCILGGVRETHKIIFR
jgi:plastocyanin